MDNGQPEHHDPNNNYQPQPQSPPPQAPLPAPAVIPTTPKKRFAPQTLIITILSVLLLATAGVLAYVLMSDRNETKSVAQTDESSKQMDAVDEAKEAAPPVKDEYAGWKTFPKDGQSLYGEPSRLESVLSSSTWAKKSEFKYPESWKSWPAIGDARCGHLMGHVISGDIVNGPTIESKGGAMCIGDEPYTNKTDTIDTKASALIATGDWLLEEDTTVGGKRAITVARVKNIPEDAGGKFFYTFIDNLSYNDYFRVGTVVGCYPRGTAADREAFLKECNLVVDSIKFTAS